jgi:protein-S-isoprenylcysteine O-methyltransferase Ste14
MKTKMKKAIVFRGIFLVMLFLILFTLSIVFTGFYISPLKTLLILFGCSVVFLAVMAALTIMRMYGEYKERKENKQVKRIL